MAAAGTSSAFGVARLMRDKRVVALTGAGLSTESGIPDYRSPGRPQRRPIQHLEFLRSEAVRARYWARSFVGFEHFARARPNAGHLALAELERRGAIAGVVTQNVDGLHHDAGSRAVIELHGALRRVRCLSCGAHEARATLQDRLREANPRWVLHDGAAAPDGDAEIDAPADFVVPGCIRCAGVLKPDVVFFGDNVERAVVERAFAWVDAADTLLVLGTSLTVFSGFRFVRRARERGATIAIVNRGPTRGDALADLVVDAALGELLDELARALA